MKLGIAAVHDFPLFSSLFSAFGQASEFREQMEDVRVEIMALIDELSARFRVIEVLLHAARLVATDKEIKEAILTYPFDDQSEVVTSTRDDMTVLVGTKLNQGPFNTEGLSLLETMLARETQIRRTKLTSFVGIPLPTSESKGLTAEMFQVFKNKYRSLYHASIWPEFKKHESSLLPLPVVRRYQHRKIVAKNKRILTARDRSKADTLQDQCVPSVDTHLFWKVGDGSVEKYVSPPVREKIKTRGQPEAPSDLPSTSNETLQVSTPTSTGGNASQIDQSSPIIRPIKEADSLIRDILWRKQEGALKWSKFVPFLTRLGCQVTNLDGSKKKVVDSLTGRCTVLHRPHPGDTCRPDQRDFYRERLEDWLHIKYTHFVIARDMESTNCQSTGALAEGN